MGCLFSSKENRQPIHSTLGFSFVPPGGSGWYENFGTTGITYFKKTNPESLSLYAGAIEGKMRTAISNNNDFLNFVKSKKDQWGSDKDRYRNISTKFVNAKNVGPYCTGYELIAEDHKAKNLGASKFLILRTKGVFCLHPKNKKNAVDIYYSARYIPVFDFSSIMNEGESFVESLRFLKKMNKYITRHSFGRYAQKQ